MKCTRCGSELNEHDKFCSICGQQVNVTQQDEQKKENIAKWFLIGSIIVVAVIAVAIAVFAMANNNDETSKKEIKTEYTMAEFKDLLEPVYENVRQDSEFLTNEEEDYINEMFVEECKKQDLPVGEKITLRGKVLYVWSENEALTVAISSQTKDDDYEISTDIIIWCEVKNCPEAVFLNENDVIAIEGIFLKEYSDDYLMFDCKIKSPTIEIDEYKNNIKAISDEAYDSYSEYLDELLYFETDVEMYGIVEDECDMTPEGFKDGFKKIFGANEKWSKYVENNNYIYAIATEDGVDGAWIFCDKDLFNLGQKVYISTSLEATLADANGERTVLILGDISSADTYYIYK